MKLYASFIAIACCCTTQCRAKKEIKSQLDYMEYTIQQYETGVLSLGSIDSSQNDGSSPSQPGTTMEPEQEGMTLLSSTSDWANFTIPSEADAENSSTNSDQTKHNGPFLRTPLLSKLNDRASRADGADNEALTIHFNKTAGAYFLFRRPDGNPSNKKLSGANGTIHASNLTSNNFDIDLQDSVNRTMHPSNAPTTKSGLPICPAPYNPLKVDYAAGQMVEVKGYMFKCKNEPYTTYCSYPTFDETLVNAMDRNETELAELWLNAWVIVGACQGVTRPSLKPSVMPVSKPDSSIAVDVYSTLEPSYQTEQRSSILPTISPTFSPSFSPTLNPSVHPTNQPSIKATLRPSTISPTESPSYIPTEQPSSTPTLRPTNKPSNKPTISPVMEITITAPPKPTNKPTTMPPTPPPSRAPTTEPTLSPTESPSFSPSFSPSLNPTISRSPTNSPSYSPTESPSASPTESPSYSPSTWSPTYYNDPISPPCASSETRVRIELKTDGFPKDTSWVFKKKKTKDQRNDGVFWRSKGYEKRSLDVREVCLESGMYEFVLNDRYGDGLCCEHGNGYYKISALGSDDVDWQLIVAGAQFAAKEVHHTIEVRDDGWFELVCEYPQRKITIDILTDNFGEDTSWQFQDENGIVIAKNERAYGKKEQDSRDLCLEDESLYEFVAFDAYKDGLCCRFGNGHYKILSYNNDLFNDENIADAGGVAILHGGMFFDSNITHIINTTLAARSMRDIAWLDAHNLRRKKYHALYEMEYVPLQWSEGLKAEAKLWADTLLDSCGMGMYHDPARIYGENAAGNTGRGSWGTQREPELILSRFVERELDDAWPHNGHLTQVLWRASRYVGCAESHKFMTDERQCHTQVCRYAVTGNCNMGRFQKLDDDINKTVIDWLTPTLEDANFCGPLCPPDGCHA